MTGVCFKILGASTVPRDRTIIKYVYKVLNRPHFQLHASFNYCIRRIPGLFSFTNDRFLTSLYQTHLYDLILDRPSEFKFGSIFVRDVSVAKVTRGREGRGAKVSHYRYIYNF